MAWCACFLRDEPPGSFPANSNCGKVAMRLFRIGKEKKMMKEIEIRDELHAPVSFGGGGSSSGSDSNSSSGGCTWSGAGHALVNGATAGAIGGAVTGSLEGGVGAFPGAALGGVAGGVGNLGGYAATCWW